MQRTRRDILRGGAYLAGALILPGIVACSKRSGGGEAPGSIAALQGDLVRAGAKPGLSVFLAGEDFAPGFDNYLGLGLVEGQTPVAGGAAKVWLAATAGPDEPGEVKGPFDAPWLGYASAAAGGPPGINAADVRFDRPGTWTALVEVSASGRRLVGTTAIGVKQKPGNRAPGDRALRTLTPTTKDPRGVDPICTRKPPCPFHRVTLAAALEAGKPTAFTIGTPAFCESRTCGPNLEELIAVSGRVGGRASFVHAEVYVDDDEAVAARIVTPTFREWAFVSEPWIYLIDDSGVIRARYEGPVTAARIERDLLTLL